MTHTTAVETQLATSCGMVLDMSDSRLETSPMRFSVSSERSRWLKKDMGSRRRCSARPMRVASVSRYAVTYVRRQSTFSPVSRMSTTPNAMTVMAKGTMRARLVRVHAAMARLRPR